ncbi:MAG: transporter substrate-binding domain-containing protein [Atopobiaceae bacterium]|nr:transporter substrate-binding domain-containing protein [Atopobiaceae bacterium]
MKKITKIAASLFAVAALAIVLAACGGGSNTSSNTEASSSGSASTEASASTSTATTSASATTYRIATDTTFAPFEYAEADGTYVGIDIELLAAVAKDQGFEYELDPLGFDAALQAVQSGQADGVIAGMSITDKRKETFDFSEAYYDSTVCAAALATGDISSLEDLAGKNVAVKSGTMSQSWAESLADEYGFTMTTFDTSDVMYQDVIAGNSAACFEDTPVMSYAISTGNVDLKLIAEADSSSEFATPYGFAVNKGNNAELLQMFNDGLKNIKDNGTYDEIVNKYVQSVG